MPPPRTRLKRLMLRTIGIALALCAAAAVVGLLSGSFDETDAKIMGTAAVVAGYALMALPAGLLLDRHRGRALAFATFALAGVGLALCVTAIWANFGEAVAKWLIAVTAWGVVGADATALALVPDGRATGWVARLRAASIGLAVAAAAMVTVAVIVEIDSSGYYRLLGAIVILALLAALLVPLAIRLAGLDREDEDYRILLVLDPGGEVERTVRASDLAAAVADAIRSAERTGARVVRIEPRGIDGGD